MSDSDHKTHDLSQEGTITNASLLNTGMKWHNFLINFSLWVGCLSNMAQAFRYFTGSVYGENREAVYLVYPMMKTADLIYSICLFILAIFVIVTRFKLARYKASGPTMLVALPAVSIILSILYLRMTSSITNIPYKDLQDGTEIGRFISTFIVMAINYIYYKKRKMLFVN